MEDVIVVRVSKTSPGSPAAVPDETGNVVDVVPSKTSPGSPAFVPDETGPNVVVVVVGVVKKTSPGSPAFVPDETGPDVVVVVARGRGWRLRRARTRRRRRELDLSTVSSGFGRSWRGTHLWRGGGDGRGERRRSAESEIRLTEGEPLSVHCS